jgi:hypothetical protein
LREFVQRVATAVVVEPYIETVGVFAPLVVEETLLRRGTLQERIFSQRTGKFAGLNLQAPP